METMDQVWYNAMAVIFGTMLLVLNHLTVIMKHGMGPCCNHPTDD